MIMTHYITTEHLVDAATKAVTEELFREFNKALQSFCNEERDRIVLFRTLRYTRIRLHVLRRHLPEEDALRRNTQNCFLDIAVGYINTELELLARYGSRAESPATRMRWTGTLELVELIYGLQEMRCIDDGKMPINELFELFGELFGLDVKVRNCYDTYLDIKRRKNDSRTYFLDKMRERLNRRMQRDDEKERMRR